MHTQHEPDSADPMAPARGCALGLILGLTLDAVIIGAIALIIMIVR